MFLPGLLTVSSCVGKHMHACVQLPFFAPENLCVALAVAVFGTEPGKRERKRMELWMIKCDTGEGEKRWTPLGEELSSCLSRGRSFWKALPITATTVFATAWFHEHSFFYSCHLPKYTLIDFNLHSVSSGYLEHLERQDVEWLLSKVTRFSRLWFADLHYVCHLQWAQTRGVRQNGLCVRTGDQHWSVSHAVGLMGRAKKNLWSAANPTEP